MKATFFILSVFLLAACSDLNPRYPTTDEDSEETLELREKYTDKVTGKWYLKQEPQEYYCITSVWNNIMSFMKTAK